MDLNQNWSLFLDRDGVINERIPDAYINHWDDFRFTRGALDALVAFSKIFKHLIVVTNQQGIGKGIMTVSQLERIHNKMQESVREAGGRMDAIYFCGELKSEKGNCRKPSPAMALRAQQDFPAIQFEKSIMVGDSISDLQFGRNVGMKTILIKSKKEEQSLWGQHKADWDYSFDSLSGMAKKLSSLKFPKK